MIEVEQDLITLESEVRDIIPELKNVQVLDGFEDGDSPKMPILRDCDVPVTLRQLLSHQSGFAYDQLNEDL